MKETIKLLNKQLNQQISNLESTLSQVSLCSQNLEKKIKITITTTIIIIIIITTMKKIHKILNDNNLFVTFQSKYIH